MITRLLTKSSLFLLSSSCVPRASAFCLVGATPSISVRPNGSTAAVSSSSRNDEAAASNMDEILTTNEEDQAAVARLQNRIAQTNTDTTNTDTDTTHTPVPSVGIDEGAHKYVLVSAYPPSSTTKHYFVTSKRGASYHRDAAEPLVDRLTEGGYGNIEVTGGGRIFLDEGERKISVFGFSYGFGLADHEKSREVIMGDGRYADYEVVVSDEGY